MKKILFFFVLLFVEKTIAQNVFWIDPATQKKSIADPASGEPMTRAEFDDVRLSYWLDTLVFVKKMGRAGAVSITGRKVVPLEFDDAQDNAQAGIREGFVAVKKDGAFGLWSLRKGRLVAPISYEFVRGFGPDFLAARRFESQTIEFFDENSQKLFETTGNSAWPGFDEKTLLVIDAAQNRRFIDRKGQPVFDEKIKNPTWTDGQFIIVQNYEAKRSSLLTTSGDTILADFEGFLQPLGGGRFLAKTEARPIRSGVFDARKRSWTMPMGDFLLNPVGSLGDSTSLLVASQTVSRSSFFCHQNGKILLDSTQFGTFEHDANAARKYGSDYKYKAYFAAQKLGNPNTTGLFSVDGRQIVPMEFERIFYRSENHPLIARRKNPTKSGADIFEAFDLKTGQKLLTEGYENLLFTDHLQGFLAKKDGKWAFLLTNSDSRTKFEIDEIQPLTTGGFAARTGAKWQAVSQTGIPLDNPFFDAITSPTTEQFLKFQKKGGEKGRLLAIGRRGSDLHSITRSGLANFFEKRPDSFFSEVISIGEPMPPMIEEVPAQPTDDPLQFAEKQPQFSGGESAMFNFLKANLKYPALAKENSIQGRVIVSFIVEKDGSLTGIIVLKDIGGGCGKEAIRLVGLMPKWTAGEQNGQPVRVKYNLPVSFKLD